MLYNAVDLKTYFETFLNTKRFGQKEIEIFLTNRFDAVLSFKPMKDILHNEIQTFFKDLV